MFTYHTTLGNKNILMTLGGKRNVSRVFEKLCELLRALTHCWCRNEVFAKMADGVPRWEIVGPRDDFVFEPP